MRNIIITTYFTKVEDPQRKRKWEADWSQLDTLIKSVVKFGLNLVVLTDTDHPENTDNVEFVRVETKYNPYFQRWISIGKFLFDNDDIENIWCVDATDVEVMKEPFFNIDENKIYCGIEETKLNNRWLTKHHRGHYIKNLIERHGYKNLLNAGVIGGSKKSIYDFCSLMYTAYSVFGYDFTDIPAINYVLRCLCFDDYMKLESGSHITTVFKSYDYKNSTNSLFRHK